MIKYNNRSVNVLIKPSSGLCNLRCRYCFYHSPNLNKNTDAHGFMKMETAENLIKRAYEYASEQVVFAFQGGEPTLCGLGFYREFIRMAESLNSKCLQINFSIQTNGIAINEEWAEFLVENKFLVGLSIDGPSRVHNTNRIDASDNPSLKRVMETKRLFDKYEVEYNALCVVTSETAKFPIQVYEFFKKQGIQYIQYIPCLDPSEEEPGLHEFSLTPDDYEKFLKVTFDLWYEDIMAGRITVIRTFDNYIAMMLGYTPESCGMSGHCACQFVIEADGSVYPCDFFVSDENIIGNVSNDTFESIIDSEDVKEFLEKGEKVNDNCIICRWYFICRDGCRRYRNPKTGLNYYCGAFRNFFDYCYPRMTEIAQKVSRRN